MKGDITNFETIELAPAASRIDAQVQEIIDVQNGAGVGIALSVGTVGTGITFSLEASDDQVSWEPVAGQFALDLPVAQLYKLGVFKAEKRYYRATIDNVGTSVYSATASVGPAKFKAAE